MTEPRYYGQFHPPVDYVLYDKYFKNRKTPGVCVECGAFDGVTESSCKFFEETLGWQAHNIEPMPSAFRDLVANRPLSRNYHMALSNRCGVAPFLQVSHPRLGLAFGNSSLRHSDQHLKELRDQGCCFEQIEVPTVTWAQFVDVWGVGGVDLLVLDVEGHELEVLEGMAGCPVMPKVVCVEAGNLGLDRVKRAMADLGYTFDGSSHVNAFFTA